jgi:hypothetical protein
MGQLAKLLRDKYPGTYDDMSDDELEKAVLAKYPEYKDLAEPKPNFIDNIMNSSVVKTARTPLYTADPIPSSNPYNPLNALKAGEEALDQPSSNMPLSMLRGFGAGALSGIANMISGATAPLDLAVMASTGGAGLAAGAGKAGLTSGLNLLTKGLSAPLIASGAQRVYSGEGALEKLFGGLEMIGGASAFVPGMNPSVAPPPRKPQLLLGAGNPPIEPSFIGGPEGMAVNRPTTIDSSAMNPDFMAGSGTILDAELGSPVQVDPALAAGGIVNPRPTPILSDAESAFQAMIPNRYRPDPPSAYGGEFQYRPGLGTARPGEPQLPSANKTRNVQAGDVSLANASPENIAIMEERGYTVVEELPDGSVTMRRNNIVHDSEWTPPGTDPRIAKTLPEPQRWDNMRQRVAAYQGKDPITGEYSNNPTPAQVAIKQSYEALKNHQNNMRGNMTPEQTRVFNDERARLESIHDENIKQHYPAQRFSPEAEIVDNAPIPPLVSPISGMPAVGIVSAVRDGRKNSPYGHVLRGADTRKRVIGTLIDALSEARPIRAEQERIYSQERGERFGKAARIKTRGEKGFYTRLRQMKGEHTKLEFESIRPKFNQAQINTLFDIIQATSTLTQGQKLRASTGLAKLLGEYGGHVPQNNEINLLLQAFEQFGPEVSGALSKSIYSNVSRARKVEGAVMEVASFRKAIMASFDLSAPLRQGLPLIHRSEWWRAWDDMFKSFGSENAYQLHRDHIKGNRDYVLAERTGLELTDLTTDKLEQFRSSAAEKIPLIGRGVKASNRAYSSFLNELRMKTFSSLLDQAERSINPNIRKDESFMRELSTFLNTSTGAGSLGKWAGAAERLNLILFSPKLMFSRFQMLNPAGAYYKMNPLKVTPADFTPEMNFIRKEKFKAIGAVAATGMTMAALAKMAGADVTLDPTNSDFLKIKVGNARIDLMGGFQQYGVLYSRLYHGARTSSVTGRELEYGSRYGYPNYEQAIIDFFYNKASPEAGLLWLGFRQRGPQGEEIDWTKEQIDRSMPILFQDIWELAQEDPSNIPFLVPSVFGGNVQVYGRERVRPF